MAIYLTHEDEDVYDEVDERDWHFEGVSPSPSPEEVARQEGGAAAWCAWSVLILAATGAVIVGHPVIGGAAIVLASVVLGLSFAPEKWWRL